MRRKSVLIGVLAAAVLIVTYLLFWPVPIDPAPWNPPKAPALEGIYEPNDLLASAEHLGEGVGIGPEDVSVDEEGRIYAGFEDGRIARFQPDGSKAEVYAKTGGRPLGHHFDAEGNLVVADARKGLLSISPEGEITVLVTEAEGRPFGLADDLDIAEDGTIYFSDASDKFDVSNYMDDLMEHRSHGRLLAYDPGTGNATLLLDDLYFANGVAVSPDQSFVLVVETGMYRVLRLWIAGPKEGDVEIFRDNLPGYPDGISAGNGTFWLALIAPRDPGFDLVSPRPFLRKVLMRLPSQFLELPKYGFVLGLDVDGRVAHNLQDPSGSYAGITSVQEHDEVLYLGSLSENSIGRLPVPLRD